MEIRPEDSISNVDSREGSINSRRSRTSSRSSVRSSASAKARATARKAILEAEAAALERLYVIQEEELRLQQRKKHLELQTNIAKAEAEERAYAIAEAEENKTLYVLDETHETRRKNVNEVSTPVAVNESATKPRKSGTVFNSFLADPNTTFWGGKLNPTVPERNYAQFSAARDNQILGRVLDSQERQSFAFQQLLENQHQNILALTLPQPDVPVFDGDPTCYCDFVRAFENLIERKNEQSQCKIILPRPIYIWTSERIDE